MADMQMFNRCNIYPSSLSQLSMFANRNQTHVEIHQINEMDYLAHSSEMMTISMEKKKKC